MHASNKQRTWKNKGIRKNEARHDYYFSSVCPPLGEIG